MSLYGDAMLFDRIRANSESLVRFARSLLLTRFNCHIFRLKLTVNADLTGTMEWHAMCGNLCQPRRTLSGLRTQSFAKQ